MRLHIDWRCDPERLAPGHATSLDRRALVLSVLVREGGATGARIARQTGLRASAIRAAILALTYEAPIYETPCVEDGRTRTRYVLDTTPPVLWRAGAAWEHEAWLQDRGKRKEAPSVPQADLRGLWRRAWVA